MQFILYLNESPSTLEQEKEKGDYISNDWLIDWLKNKHWWCWETRFSRNIYPYTLQIDHIKNENIPTDGQKENVKQFKMDIDSRRRKKNFTQEIHWILCLTQEYDDDDDHLSLTSIRWTNEEVISTYWICLFSVSLPSFPLSDGKMMNISIRVQSSQ
jgi:hypothetical protein